MTPIQQTNMARRRERNLATTKTLRDIKAKSARNINVWLVTLPLEDKLALKEAWLKTKKEYR